MSNENTRAPAGGSDEALALAAAWKDLFWQVALSIKCLPSSFIDGNEHVLRALRNNLWKLA